MRDEIQLQQQLLASNQVIQRNRKRICKKLWQYEISNTPFLFYKSQLSILQVR